MSLNNVEALVPAQSLIDREWVMGGFVNVAPGLADPKGWPVERHTDRTAGEVATITFVGPGGLLAPSRCQMSWRQPDGSSSV